MTDGMRDDEPPTRRKSDSGGSGGAGEASVQLTTEQIQKIVANFVAERGSVRAPFVYHFKWIWSRDGSGPICHVKVTRAPDNLVEFPKGKGR